MNHKVRVVNGNGDEIDQVSVGQEFFVTAEKLVMGSFVRAVFNPGPMFAAVPSEGKGQPWFNGVASIRCVMPDKDPVTGEDMRGDVAVLVIGPVKKPESGVPFSPEVLGTAGLVVV